MGMEYSAAKLFGPALHFKQADLKAPFIGVGYEDTFLRPVPSKSNTAHTQASVCACILAHGKRLRAMGNDIRGDHNGELNVPSATSCLPITEGNRP